MKSTPSAPPPDDPVIRLPSSVMWSLPTTVEAGQRPILPAHLDTADTLAAFDALDEGWIPFARDAPGWAAYALDLLELIVARSPEAVPVVPDRIAVIRRNLAERGIERSHRGNSMREGVQAKGRRYLTEGRGILEHVDGSAIRG